VKESPKVAGSAGNGVKKGPHPRGDVRGRAETDENGMKVYGERLLFYYAGRKTIYLGTLKLYTVLLFSYCALVVAPSIGLETEYGILAPAGGIISSLSVSTVTTGVDILV
jgi:hypothetical protein